ncbi:hypothetical protein KIH39_10930 [Telmatocola sphagniphila]|uniref:PPM-type phosphatase domain-containing protein n=1 Tax=Telmatocola sphagniphila TaxID=1123043 RepID=A0A8E6EWV9_9BACT|nr:hypothetical protein [Telmatocola sphagniphila]QVL34390.1 hypothetical protein KIH39_10930 [Telmatocola sphagniphila]
MTSQKPFRWSSFSQPKKGHSLAEYEDSAAADLSVCRFAIADGASESSYSGEWANKLTFGFIENSLLQAPNGWADWLPPLQKLWANSVPASPENISWFAEEKLHDGAFATFLGLEFTLLPNERTYQAIAVGDSCLFHVRDDKLVKAFPLQAASEFSSRPALLSSKPRSAGKTPMEKRLLANFLPGDIFYLMTDALACWFLTELESGKKPWLDLNDIRSLPTPEMFFETWVTTQRESAALKNDDITLLVIDALE